ncbi:MAG: DUF1566 domain-containing protein [Kangiellaceae bacterium]|nr:DUF1566 domain-containing protein [Kangiellaceae bacterium]
MKKILFLITLLLLNKVLLADCVDNIATTSGPFDTSGIEGTVLDESTGLVWYQCRLGEIYEGGICMGDESSVNWLETLSLAESFEFEGFDDWRLPNIKELQSIVEYSCHSPSLNTAVFHITQNNTYWSSTPELVDDGGLFQVRAYYLSSAGRTGSDQKNETFGALLVRDVD